MLVCDCCGSEFQKWNLKGRNPLRCSPECARKANLERLREYPRQSGSARVDPGHVKRVRECAVCGVEWSNTGRGRGQLKFCSGRCRDAAAKGMRNPKEPIPCSQGCGTFLPGSAFQLVGFSRWCGVCERKRPHAIALKVRTKVYERDGWLCQLCLEPVDSDDVSDGIVGSTYPTVDHIIPRSKGGSDKPHNLRTAHHLCNSIRGIPSNEQLMWAI